MGTAGGPGGGPKADHLTPPPPQPPSPTLWVPWPSPLGEALGTLGRRWQCPPPGWQASPHPVSWELMSPRASETQRSACARQPLSRCSSSVSGNLRSRASDSSARSSSSAGGGGTTTREGVKFPPGPPREPTPATAGTHCACGHPPGPAPPALCWPKCRRTRRGPSACGAWPGARPACSGTWGATGGVEDGGLGGFLGGSSGGWLQGRAGVGLAQVGPGVTPRPPRQETTSSNTPDTPRGGREPPSPPPGAHPDPLF